MKVPPERWPAMLNGAKLVPIADTRPPDDFGRD
jgi:hypothetical protein